MKTEILQQTMARGNLTAREICDALRGPGSGCDEQYRKLSVEFGGTTLNMEYWYPGRSDQPGLPAGAAELVWSHTGQRCPIDRELLLSLLDAIADEKAGKAEREVESAERAGHTKSLPRGWSYDGGFVVDQHNEII